MTQKKTTRRNNLYLTTICIMFLIFLLTGCGNEKLVDMNQDKMGAIIESIQTDYAEDYLTYSGFEVQNSDDAKDMVTVAITYDVDGDLKKLLKENSTKKAKYNYIYGLAENVTAKAIVELSSYDRDNNKVESKLQSVEWYVGETELNAWIKQENAKWKNVGDKIPISNEHGSIEVTIDGASKTDWDKNANDSYIASIRAIVKNIEYKETLFDEGVSQYDIIDNKDIIVTTIDGVSCAGGDILGPTDGSYDPSTQVAPGETGRVCLEIIVPAKTKIVVLKFGLDTYLYLPISQKTISY